jgi:hypothetical protein
MESGPDYGDAAISGQGGKQSEAIPNKVPAKYYALIL